VLTVNTQPGVSTVEASTVVTSSLAAHPDLAAVFATNTLTGQGAAQAQVVLKPLDLGTSGIKEAVNAPQGRPVEKLIHTGALIATKANLNSPDVHKYLYRANCTG
jgi:ribose transport system substrate-binding protein